MEVQRVRGAPLQEPTAVSQNAPPLSAPTRLGSKRYCVSATIVDIHAILVQQSGVSRSTRAASHNHKTSKQAAITHLLGCCCLNPPTDEQKRRRIRDKNDAGKSHGAR